jgi:predicted nucleotide-binding protein
MKESSQSSVMQPKKQLSPDQIKRGIGRLQERINELRAFNVGVVPEGASPELTALSTAIRDTLDRCFGEGTAAFARFEGATKLNASFMMYTTSYPQRQHYQEGAQQNIQTSIALLQEAQRTLNEDLADVLQGDSAPSPKSRNDRSSSKVFIVHGHDNASKHELARFLEKLGLEAVVLHEQANQGRVIIEKFLECAGEVGFAVVLLTPDDFGRAMTASEPNPRARQNVVFELGYFVAALGRGRVCLLRKGDVEIPSDLYGVIYTELDAHEGWKMQIVKELRAAGLSFDANRVWG